MGSSSGRAVKDAHFTIILTVHLGRPPPSPKEAALEAWDRSAEGCANSITRSNRLVLLRFRELENALFD